MLMTKNIYLKKTSKAEPQDIKIPVLPLMPPSSNVNVTEAKVEPITLSINSTSTSIASTEHLPFVNNSSISNNTSTILDVVPKDTGSLLSLEQHPKLELPAPPVSLMQTNNNSNKMEISQPTPILPAQNLPLSQPQPPTPNMMIPTITTNNIAPLPAIVNNTNNPLHVHNNNSNNNSKLPSSASLNMNQFTDPLEHTLASLEQPQLNISKNQDINSMFMDIQKQHQQQQQLNQLMSQIPVTHPSNPNNFGADFNGVNGLMNILGIQQSVESANLQLLNQQMKGSSGRFPDVWNVPNPSLPMTNPMTSRNNNPPNWEHQQTAVAMKQDKIILTPKPIQELLANVNEKPKLINTNAPDIRVNPAFVQSFKYEQNLKNANSWSQLASSHETLNTSSKSKLPSDTFQEFRTKAKEQQQRQKQEAEKIKRQQKEQELKRQQETLQKQTKDDGNNGQR